MVSASMGCHERAARLAHRQPARGVPRALDATWRLLWIRRIAPTSDRDSVTANAVESAKRPTNRVARQHHLREHRAPRWNPSGFVRIGQTLEHENGGQLVSCATTTPTTTKDHSVAAAHRSMPTAARGRRPIRYDKAPCGRDHVVGFEKLVGNVGSFRCRRQRNLRSDALVRIRHLLCQVLRNFSAEMAAHPSHVAHASCRLSLRLWGVPWVSKADVELVKFVETVVDPTYPTIPEELAGPSNTASMASVQEKTPA
mmetsp:Transcript_87905/g.246920  ORF Transcript_87905/g.246920 Transcript_87905/m.246920 type:complete len:256 (+) Transcript_87905:188-955(+)